MIDLDDEDVLRLIDLFRQKAADRRHELRMAETQQIDADRKRHHELELKKEEEQRKFEEALATTDQIRAFDERLDSYDTATVHALMDNQNALELVERRKGDMEASAYRLPDGRLVFKTEDGKHVFDRQGAAIPAEVLHTDAIPDAAPRWEEFRTNIDAEHKLLREREDLHQYQRRLDESRAAVAKGDVIAEALAKMDADLKRDMPDSIRERIAARRSIEGLSSTIPRSDVMPDRVPLAYPQMVPPGP